MGILIGIVAFRRRHSQRTVADAGAVSDWRGAS